MFLSIVTTLYCSSEHINEFYERISKSVKKITNDYEIIFVNDGSPDNSLNILIKLYEKDTHIKIIDLSRNFGHHKAIMAGLKHTQGEYVFLIDCDLEEKPELLNLFWKKYFTNTQSIDVLYGVQKKRKGEWFEKISGSVFFDIFNFISDIKIKKNVSVIRLMSHDFVKKLLKHNETELIFVGLCELTGFSQKSIYFEKSYRGISSYGLKQKIQMAIDMIASFSNKPLIYVFNLGVTITFFSILFILYLVFNKYFNEISVDGWTSIIASMWLLGGLIMLSIGVIGIYLSKIFLEVKNRPNYIIKKIYE